MYLFQGHNDALPHCKAKTRPLLLKSLLPDTLSLLIGTGTFPLTHCELSRLRCHYHSLLLSSYLCRIKRKENSSCNTCGLRLQDLSHLQDCLTSERLRRAMFDTTSIFSLKSRPWGAPDCWVSEEFFHAPKEGVWQYLHHAQRRKSKKGFVTFRLLT